jgi:hypothetical protein
MPTRLPMLALEDDMLHQPYSFLHASYTEHISTNEYLTVSHEQG